MNCGTLDERYKKYFSDEETDKLLDLICHFQLKFQLNRKNHSSLWKEIADELRKQMIYKTPIQCKNRLENLKRKYNQMQRKKTKNNDITMANWRYLAKIEDLIKSKSLSEINDWMVDPEKLRRSPANLIPSCYQLMKEGQPQTSNSPAKHHAPIVIKLEDDASSNEMTLPSVLPESQIPESSTTSLKVKIPRYRPVAKRTVIKKRKHRTTSIANALRLQNLGIHAFLEYLRQRDHREILLQAERVKREKQVIECIEKLIDVLGNKN